jgi:hypothetical protein
MSILDGNRPENYCAAASSHVPISITMPCGGREKEDDVCKGLQMKALFVAFIILVSAGPVDASPSKQITDSCLKTETIPGDTTYKDLSPSSFYVEEDSDRNIVSKTILHRNQYFGMWERTSSDEFGLVLNDREVPVAEVKTLNGKPPTIFVPYTSWWGEVRNAKEAYLCITFNFGGFGESGSFQNVRGVYIFDLNRQPASIYYLVGDVRTLGK